MSKKAKKASRKRASTKDLEAALADVTKHKDLAAQMETIAHKHQRERIELEKKVGGLEDRIARSTDTNINLRASIDDLKRIIAGLEKNCAENLGTIRALNRQIDQAAPKVMVTPPRYLSPQEAAQFHSSGRVGGQVDLDALERELNTKPKRHWTAI